MWLTRKYYHVSVWEWIVLILALILLSTYICCQTRAPNLEKYISKNSNNLRWNTVNEILNIAENGDVILLAGDTRGERTCKWCTNSMFSHVGVLFWEVHPVTNERILYVFDCDLGQGTKEGVRVMPLRDKLHRYNGARVGALKKLIVHPPANRPTRDQFVGLLSKYTPIDFDSVIATWWVADWNWLYRLTKNHNTMFCGELVASVLQDVGVMKKDRVPAWYIPGDFHKNRLHLEEGYSYGETIFFEFSKDQTQIIIDKSLPVETGMKEFIGGDYTTLPGMKEWMESLKEEKSKGIDIPSSDGISNEFSNSVTSQSSGDSKTDYRGKSSDEKSLKS